MGVLAARMKSHMELKGFSSRTVDIYLRRMSDFVRFVGHSPETMTAEEMREYLHHLLGERELSQSTVNQAYSALRLFYEQILEKSWEETRIPRARRRKLLPVVLSPNEVEALFAATRNAKHRAILMTVYSGGLRLQETTHLKVTDIDSERMLIRVRQGKGRKDRYTLLSKRTLAALRDYWRTYQPATDWLFPGQQQGHPLSSSSVQKVFRRARDLARIKKAASVHTLRHSFATHLLDAGASLHHIQHLLGHTNAHSTSIYLHLTSADLSRIPNPMDQWTPSELSSS